MIDFLRRLLGPKSYKILVSYRGFQDDGPDGYGEATMTLSCPLTERAVERIREHLLQDLASKGHKNPRLVILAITRLDK